METTNQFSEMAQRLFGDFATSAAIEAAEAGQLPQDLWKALEESGIGLVMVAEKQGGIGAGLPEVAAILLEAGRHAVPGPVLELVLGNYLLGLAGREPQAGPLAVALVDKLVDSSGPLLVRNVAWARGATHVVMLGRTASGTALALLPASQLELRQEIADASGEPCANFDLPPRTQWHPLESVDFDACLRRAAVLRGAQMMGAMRWCLERTTAYAQERKQFGREIGKFQVVQQMIAEMASAVVASHAILDAAIAEPDNARMVAAARSRLGDAADTVFAHAHQVHGAIGFSYEYVLHFRTRRMMAWRDQFGTVAHWRRVLAGSFAGRRADEVWPLIAS